MRSKILFLSLICLGITQSLYAFSIVRIGPKPCAGQTGHYQFKTDCGDWFWTAGYEKNGIRTIINTGETGSYNFQVDWPSAADGGIGTVTVSGKDCCSLCGPSNANFTELFTPFTIDGSFTIDGTGSLDCSFSGQKTFTINPQNNDAAYQWESNGGGGLSASPVSGQLTRTAVFNLISGIGTGVITVKAYNPCYYSVYNTPNNVPAVTKQGSITRTSLPVPNSLTITATSYPQNTTKNSSGVMTISGNQTPSSGVIVNFKTDNTIKVIPETILLPGINLKAVSFLCGSSGRYATIEEEPAKPATQEEVNFENNSYLIAHPNPSNGITNIKYKVANKGSVKLYVTDNMGRPTTNLVDDKNVAPGEYKTVFNSNELSSGIYFYTLITNGHRETKRLTVIKE